MDWPVWRGYRTSLPQYWFISSDYAPIIRHSFLADYWLVKILHLNGGPVFSIPSGPVPDLFILWHCVTASIIIDLTLVVTLTELCIVPMIFWLALIDLTIVDCGCVTWLVLRYCWPWWPIGILVTKLMILRRPRRKQFDRWTRWYH